MQIIQVNKKGSAPASQRSGFKCPSGLKISGLSLVTLSVISAMIIYTPIDKLIAVIVIVFDEKVKKLKVFTAKNAVRNRIHGCRCPQ